jgi:hypothetical protein
MSKPSQNLSSNFFHARKGNGTRQNAMQTMGESVNITCILTYPKQEPAPYLPFPNKRSRKKRINLYSIIIILPILLLFLHLLLLACSINSYHHHPAKRHFIHAPCHMCFVDVMSSSQNFTPTPPLAPFLAKVSLSCALLIRRQRCRRLTQVGAGRLNECLD